MKDFESPFVTINPKNNKKSQKPKTKGFGYQILGFGSGGKAPEFIVATGGNTVTTCGNFKIHKFTGPGTFTVCSVGCAAGSNTVDYLVVAGGGGGGKWDSTAGGGGAGGYRASGYGPSPLRGTALPVSATGYPITVGGGGAGGPSPKQSGNDGSNSVFSTITSTGGGGGGAHSPTDGRPGGSGGGGPAATHLPPMAGG